MTNKEAINEICDMANALQIMYKSKQGQALQMGIEALENQKTIIEELEKIKEEISCIYENDKTMWDGSVIYIKEAVIYEIIDNRIKELEGE